MTWKHTKAHKDDWQSIPWIESCLLFPGYIHKAPSLEADNLLITLKQPDFLVPSLDVREEGFQGGSRYRNIA